MKIQISDPKPESKIGYETIHDIHLDNKNVGYVIIQYATKEDIKAFKKSKRKFKVGQPFGVRLCIDVDKGGMTASEIGKPKIMKIVDSLKSTFSGLEERDVGIIEYNGGKKNIIGKISNL
jgi:hypothetical protein